MEQQFMRTSDYAFDLPQKLIAQSPVEPRDTARLLTVNMETGVLEHRVFSDIADILQPDDCLILNDSRVLPARIYGIKESTGARIEFLLLKNCGNDCWEALAGPGRKAKIDDVFCFGAGVLHCTVVQVLENGNRVIAFSYDGNFFEALDKVGQMPLPPYIKETLQDQQRYQTVYAKERGSAAAPTAGLHFTDTLLSRIRAKGVGVGFVTLHVGLGTFRPVSAAVITDHKMHAEHYDMPAETAALIQKTKQNGGRVFAVGTTSCRTIESVAQATGAFCESAGWTDIFIYPGYVFQGVDCLITNFHLPESSLMMLVSALAGREHIMHAYAIAVQEQYRFFSFGDAMLLYRPIKEDSCIN